MALAAAAQPQVTWLERQHDFGVFLEADGKVTCSMALVNTGTEPLIIVKAQAGCGCTGITYPEEAIQPGDTASVSISYNPSGRPGQFSKEVLIFTNTVPKRTILEITGNVIPTAATLDKQYPLQAGSLRISQQSIPFGELTKGQNKTLYLSAYNASTDTILVKVTALTVHYLTGHAPLWGLNTDTLTLSCEPLHQPSTVQTGTADVHVMAQVLEGFDRLTDEQRKHAPVVSVDCDDRIDFGTMAAGETVTRTLTVTNKGKDVLAIRRLWVPEGEGIDISTDRLEVKRGKSATVTITVNTAQIDGELLNVPLTLMCNDPDNPRQTIRLVGIIDRQ